MNRGNVFIPTTKEIISLAEPVDFAPHPNVKVASSPVVILLYCDFAEFFPHGKKWLFGMTSLLPIWNSISLIFIQSYERYHVKAVLMGHHLSVQRSKVRKEKKLKSHDPSSITSDNL